MTEDATCPGVVLLAQAWVIKQYDHHHLENRRWGIGIAHPDSYQDPAYRVTLYVRLGSPPKGYVIGTEDFAQGIGIGHLTKVFVRQHICEVDYRSEHAWARRPEIRELCSE